MQEVNANTIEIARTTSADIIAQAYHLGTKAKKKNKKVDLSLLLEEYNRDLENAIRVNTIEMLQRIYELEQRLDADDGASE